MPVEDKLILEIFRLSQCCDIGGESQRHWMSAEWDPIIDRIAELGIAGVMYERISASDQVVKPPPQVMKNLQMAVRSLAMNNAFYEIEGVRVLQDFAAINVEYILLKGFSYMEKIYGNTWARSVSDLDILVHQTDFPKIIDCLRQAGFSYYTTDGLSTTDEEIIRLTEFSGEASFFKKIGVMTVNIDLHWSIDAYWEGYPLNALFPIHEYPWWDSAQYTTLQDTEIRCLSPEMQFIHMVMHFSVHHQYQGMKWFLEICIFMDKFGPSLDWNTIDKIVVTPDCRKALGMTMRMATEIIGEDCVSMVGIWRRFYPKKGLLPGEYRFFRKYLTHDVSSVVRRYLCLVMLPVTIKEKGRMLSFIMFNPEAVLLWRLNGKKYSRWMQPLYIGYRAGRALLKSGGKKLMCKSQDD